GSAPGERPRTAVPGATVTPAPVAEGPTRAQGTAAIRLVPAAPGDAVYYTLGGGAPDQRYRRPLTVTAPATITFRAVRGGVPSPLVQTTVDKIDPARRITLSSAP